MFNELIESNFEKRSNFAEMMKTLKELNANCPFQLGTHGTDTAEKAENICKTGLSLKLGINSLDANAWREIGRFSYASEQAVKLALVGPGTIAAWGRYKVMVAFPNEIGWQKRLPTDKDKLQDDMATEADVLIFGLGIKKTNLGHDEFRHKLSTDFILGYVDYETGNFSFNQSCLLFSPEAERENKIEEYKKIVAEKKETCWVFADMYKHVKWEPYNQAKEKQQAD